MTMWSFLFLILNFSLVGYFQGSLLFWSINVSSANLRHIYWMRLFTLN